MEKELTELELQQGDFEYHYQQIRQYNNLIERHRDVIERMVNEILRNKYNEQRSNSKI